jgi:hypothetical protein
MTLIIGQATPLNLDALSRNFSLRARRRGCLDIILLTGQHSRFQGGLLVCGRASTIKRLLQYGWGQTGSNESTSGRRHWHRLYSQHSVIAVRHSIVGSGQPVQRQVIFLSCLWFVQRNMILFVYLSFFGSFLAWLTILIFPICLPNPFICSAFFITKLERYVSFIYMWECDSVWTDNFIVSLFSTSSLLHVQEKLDGTLHGPGWCQKRMVVPP